MKTNCSACGVSLEYDREMAGETVPCENCGGLVMLRRATVLRGPNDLRPVQFAAPAAAESPTSFKSIFIICLKVTAALFIISALIGLIFGLLSAF